MRAVLLNPPRHKRRRRRRGKRRNTVYWTPDYKTRTPSANRKRRNRRYGKRRKKRNYSTWIPAYKGHSTGSNPYWIPQYARNPGAGGIISAMTRGFRPNVLAAALPFVAGGLGNAVFSGVLSRYVPDFLKSGLGNIALSLGTSGLLGAAAGTVRRTWAFPVFMGGVIEASTRLIQEFLSKTGMSGLLGLDDCPSCPPMGDYLTVTDAQVARPLGNMPNDLGPAWKLMGQAPIGMGPNYQTLMDQDPIQEVSSNELTSI